jgi:hypothetical protein
MFVCFCITSQNYYAEKAKFSALSIRWVLIEKEWLWLKMWWFHQCMQAPETLLAAGSVIFHIIISGKMYKQWPASLLYKDDIFLKDVILERSIKKVVAKA